MNTENTEDKNSIESFEEVVDAKKQHKVDKVVDALKLQVKKTVGKYKDLLIDYKELEQELQFIKSIDLSTAKPVPIEPLFKQGIDEGMALAIGSDWHGLETVFKEQVNFLNEYNRAIAERSIKNFFKGIIYYVEMYRHVTKVPILGIPLLGDLISNMIHEDQKECNSGTPQEETFFIFELLVSGLDYLLKEGKFERIVLYCCDGNHGRDTDKIRHTNRVKHSHEWLMYKFLEKWYKDRGEDRLEFQIADAYHLYTDIFDKRVRMHHGDEVRYQGGVGGLTIPMNKAIAKWNEGIKVDLDIFGHFHTSLSQPNFISNGCILGHSPFGISIKAGFEPPSQTFVLIDKERWITGVHKIYVR